MVSTVAVGSKSVGLKFSVNLLLLQDFFKPDGWRGDREQGVGGREEGNRVERNHEKRGRAIDMRLGYKQDRQTDFDKGRDTNGRGGIKGRERAGEKERERELTRGDTQRLEERKSHMAQTELPVVKLSRCE